MESGVHQNIQIVEKIFNQSGYNTIKSEFQPSKICFDVIALKQAPAIFQYIITKVVKNIDSIAEEDLRELTIFAHIVGAFPILIGEMNRRSNLRDHAIYFRDNRNLIAINLTTFQDLIVKNILPHLVAKRGSYLTKIDGKKLKDIREKNSLSRKQLAEELKVSIKTVSEYERAPTVKIYLKNAQLLEELFKVKLIIPLDLYAFFRHQKWTNDVFKSNSKLKTSDNEFAFEISEFFEELGFDQYWAKRSPFDVIFSPKIDEDKKQPSKTVNNLMVSALFSKSNGKTNNNDSKLETIAKVFRTLHLVCPVIVEDSCDAKICAKKGLPVIKQNELKEVQKPKELQKLILKRSTML